MFKKKSLLLFIFFTFISLAYLDSYPHSGGGGRSSGGSSRGHSGSRSFSYPKSSSSSPSGSSYRSYGRHHHSHGTHHDDQENKSTQIFLWAWFFVMFFSMQFLIRFTSEEPIKGNKQNVYLDYDKVATWFDDNRSRAFYEKKYLDNVIELLPRRATILDLGCGMGEPIAQYFIQEGYQLTGVDGSQNLIDLAKQRLPEGQFLVGDMRTISLYQKFDCVVAWHSFFHLPPDDQRKMFETFKQCLKFDGVLLLTTGPSKSEVWSNNGGIDMYHASLSSQEYKRLLQQHGFELILHVVKDKKCGDATVWIAKLKL